jgi:hypothetical protein
LRVEEGADREQAVHHRPHELLLSGDPGEVGDRVPLDVPGPHERQGLLPIERGTAGLRDRQTGLLVVHGPIDAHTNAAEGVHEPLEARQVHLDVVVHREPREGLHGLHHEVGSPELVGGVDLVDPMPGDPDPEVAGQVHDNGLLPARIDVEQDDRVRPLPLHGFLGSEGRLLFLREAGPGIAAEEQDVPRTLREVRRLVEAPDGLDGVFAELEQQVDPPHRRGRHEHRQRPGCHQDP